MREQNADDAVRVGFSTHQGSVIAATDRDGPPQRKRVRPGLPGSCEARSHASRIGRCQPRQDDPERQGRYFRTVLSRQFDGLIHVNATSALVPLEPGERWHAGVEAPQT